LQREVNEREMINGELTVANRSDRGAHAQALLMSIHCSLHLRTSNPTQAVTAALKTYIAGGQLPLLPAAHIAGG